MTVPMDYGFIAALMQYIPVTVLIDFLALLSILVYYL